MKLYLLLVFVGLCAAESFDEGFSDASAASDLKEGIIAEWPVDIWKIGTVTFQIQVKTKDGYHDFCIRIPTMFKKAIKGCAGFKVEENAESNRHELHYRLRAGKTSVYSDKTDHKLVQNMKRCFEVHTVVGEICLSDVSYDYEGCEGGRRRKFCATMGSTVLGKGAKACAIFCAAKFEKFKHEWIDSWTKP